MSNNRRSRELAIETLSILAERFPSAFMLKGLRRPLKIGIDRDLAEGAPDLSMPAIKQALRLYVSSASYQRALADGAERIDLAGRPAGSVSPAAKNKTDERRALPEPVVTSPAPPVAPSAADQQSTTSRRPTLTLAALREAARQRKASQK